MAIWQICHVAVWDPSKTHASVVSIWQVFTMQSPLLGIRGESQTIDTYTRVGHVAT